MQVPPTPDHLARARHLAGEIDREDVMRILEEFDAED
ncbi:hypothetical protein ACVJBD_003374 [Rhizobium mongolense]